MNQSTGRSEALANGGTGDALNTYPMTSPVDPAELVQIALPRRVIHDATESPRVAKMRVALIAAASWIEALEKDGNRRAGMHNAAEQEANRLRAVIENAPHDVECNEGNVWRDGSSMTCTCWKADAL